MQATPETMAGHLACKAVLLIICLCSGYVGAIYEQDQGLRLDQTAQLGRYDLEASGLNPQASCSRPEDFPAAKLANLTSDERDLLPNICWQPELEGSLQAPGGEEGYPRGR